MHDDDAARNSVRNEPERRRRQRRGAQLAIFTDRRAGDRRRPAREFLDRLRAFLGLPPLS